MNISSTDIRLKNWRFSLNSVIGGHLEIYVKENQLRQVAQAFIKERKEYIAYKKKIEGEQYARLTKEGNQEG